MDFFKSLNAHSTSRRGPPPPLPSDNVVIRREIVREKKKKAAPEVKPYDSSKSKQEAPQPKKVPRLRQRTGNVKATSKTTNSQDPDKPPPYYGSKTTVAPFTLEEHKENWRIYRLKKAGINPDDEMQHDSTRRSNGRKRARSVQRLFESSSDEAQEGAEDDERGVRKRSKMLDTKDTKNEWIDPDRTVCHERALDMEKAPKKLSIIQAADITSLDEICKFKPAFTNLKNADGKAFPLEVELQYPSNSHKERYFLVHPLESETFEPVSEILSVMTLVPTYYLPAEISARFVSRDDPKSLVRRLKRAIAASSLPDFLQTVQQYNADFLKLLTSTIPSTLPTLLTSPLPLPLVEHILTQTYARTVSPKVDSLRQYENGTDFVYGELLPRFCQQIFKDTNLKSHHTFVDLGSGVANVVLQAALQIGCESWGCEVMPNASTLAAAQLTEFKVRTRLWGLSTGAVHLEAGDFCTNKNISEALKKADVILVNNQAFTPPLNQALLNMFLDLKEGCWIVSLKSFVPKGWRITSRNAESVVNLLECEDKEYWGGDVSWSGAPGRYVVSRKTHRMLHEFLAQKEKRGRK